MRDIIESTVLDLLRTACLASGISADVSADRKLAELAIDSMKLIEMIFELERRFGFEADEGQLTDLTTVRDLIDMVETMLPAGAGSQVT